MKAKVIKRFKDKHTGERHLPGGLFDGETARVNELVNKGYLHVHPVEKYYDSMTKKELQALLDEQGKQYSAKDTKDILVGLLGGD